MKKGWSQIGHPSHLKNLYGFLRTSFMNSLYVHSILSTKKGADPLCTQLKCYMATSPLAVAVHVLNMKQDGSGASLMLKNLHLG